jgi:sulfite exporter TauE/SafE
MINQYQFKETYIAFGIASLILIFFVLLQKIGLVQLISGGELGYGAIFFIGLIASLSTCMAVVGGLLLSMSATFAKGGDKVRPQVLFHVGRFVSFIILGGVIGAIGTAFTLSTLMTFVLNLTIGVVMLILGFKLLEIFPAMSRIRISFPAFFRKHVEGVAMMNHTLTPFLVGIATFFMPCGFTQSMQLYTLGTGSFLSGALTMFVFALGTFPILALVSFSSLSVTESRYVGLFYKTAGIIVIAFALMNIINSFVVIGFIPPVFTF